MRLSKWLAQNGIASRRTVESWITAGRIKINGKPAILGVQVTPNDRITIDDQKVQLKAHSKTKTRILAYHKPEGEICSTLGYGKPTVFENLPPLTEGRWIMVGRLDLNSSGLLLFTNQGELANHLMHPKNQIERQYAVRILGVLSTHAIEKLKQGVEFPEGLAKAKAVELQRGKTGANRWCKVTLTEGKHREVRRLFEAVNCKVSRLIRIRYGAIALPRDLKPGQCREINQAQVQSLLNELNQEAFFTKAI